MKKGPFLAESFFCLSLLAAPSAFADAANPMRTDFSSQARTLCPQMQDPELFANANFTPAHPFIRLFEQYAGTYSDTNGRKLPVGTDTNGKIMALSCPQK